MDESKVIKLEECDQMQLALLLMREIYWSFDNGGISGRAVESLLPEVAMRLRETKDWDWAPTYFFEDIQVAIENKLSDGSRTQTILFYELPFLPTEEYMCLCVEKIKDLHKRDKYKLVAPQIKRIRLLAKVLRSRDRFPKGFVRDLDPYDIVEEGGNRAFKKSNYENWLI